MKGPLLSILLLLGPAQSYGDDWLCTEAAAQKRGKAIVTCGIGEAATEAEARSLALANAKKEFHSLCDEDDCKNHEVSLTPLRNECKTLKNDRIQCRRALEYEVLEKIKDNLAETSETTTVRQAEEAKPQTPNAAQRPGSELIKNREAAEALPVFRVTTEATPTSKVDDRLILLSTIPMCTEIEVRGRDSKRHLPCNENPRTLLVHQSDTELVILGPKGYKSRRVVLRSNNGSNDDNSETTLEVFLEKL